MVESDSTSSGNQEPLTPLMTADAVAKYLGVKVKTVHQLVREGRLSCVQLTARDRRFTREQVEEFVTRRTVTVPNPVDKSVSKPLPSTQKGGAKSLGFNRARLRKEMRSW
jgi:excisionase family DNA binding protein